MSVFQWVIAGVAAYSLFVVVLARWLRAAASHHTRALPPFRPIPVASASARPARGTIRIAA